MREGGRALYAFWMWTVRLLCPTFMWQAFAIPNTSANRYTSVIDLCDNRIRELIKRRVSCWYPSPSKFWWYRPTRKPLQRDLQRERGGRWFDQGRDIHDPPAAYPDLLRSKILLVKQNTSIDSARRPTKPTEPPSTAHQLRTSVQALR